MSEFFTNPVKIKQEGGAFGETTMNSSASVPIPSSTIRRDFVDFRLFGLELEGSPSPVMEPLQVQDPLDGTMWTSHIVNSDEMLKSELTHMDDDDIFQVDKADLIQGPGLAELNANEEAFLGDLNFDDLLLPEEGEKSLMMLLNNNSNSSGLMASSCPPQGGGTLFGYYGEAFGSSLGTPSAFSPLSQTSSNSSLVHNSPMMAPSVLQQKHSTLHELLLKRDNYGEATGSNTPSPAPPTIVTRSHAASRLSSSAPTHLGLEQIWQRREPRKHLLSTGSLAEAGSTSSISTGLLSPDPPEDLSHDEFESVDDDSDHYEDFSSENGDSDDDDPDHAERRAAKKERYFWQYNVQAKGPKGQRLVMKCKMEDPHVLHEVTDPVFSPDCSVRGIKHSGKARKGDGNDLTPNAKKLFNIGRELDKLGRIINDMTPVSELPFNVRPTSRKEKNKLASRACRLKKKAQHEANKIKLNGLENEHKRLINAIVTSRHILAAKMGEQKVEQQDELSKNLDKIYKSSTIKVAGHTTDYVNKVLERVKPAGSSSLKIEDHL